MRLSLAEGEAGYKTGAAVLRVAFPEPDGAMESDVHNKLRFASRAPI
jgi:hypothetical protein